MSIQKVSLGAVQIRKLSRVVLDKHLLITIGLAVGDRVTVELDVKSDSIILRKVQRKADAVIASSASDKHVH